MRNGTVLRRLGASALVTAGLVAACGGGGSSTYGGSEPGEGIPLGLVQLEVESEHVECTSIVPEHCVGVRDVEHGYEWRVYDWEIGGITLEEGSSYVLDVRIEEVDDPPEDGSSISYELEELIEASPGAG